MKQNIILIGFMGVGKGTIARNLVKKGGYVSIDTDDIIESMENRKIKEIFKTEGEAYFRSLEAKVAKWLRKSVKSTIISTGGGFYKQEKLGKIGKVIYLQNSYEGIMRRILSSENADKKLAKRPLLSDAQKAKELFAEREPAYKAVADYIVDVEDKDVSKITDEILTILEEL
jgi:shikimate kinase